MKDTRKLESIVRFANYRQAAWYFSEERDMLGLKLLRGVINGDLNAKKHKLWNVYRRGGK